MVKAGLRLPANDANKVNDLQLVLGAVNSCGGSRRRRHHSPAARASGVEPLPPGTPSAGGMPDRVKCLHALAAHALAVPGVNPLGAEAVQAAGRWWQAGSCAKDGL